MGKWFARLYDMVLAPIEQTKFKKIRKSLIGKAKGRVLEIGSGTGVNFPFYQLALHVDAIEPDHYMRKKSLKRLDKSEIPIQTHLVKAEKLPFADHTFDTVVGTLVFCTIPNPERALKEVQRVCKPDGKVLLFEHVRLNHSKFGPLQDALTPVWSKVSEGCRLNQNTVELLQNAGFIIHTIEEHFKGLFLVIKCVNEERRTQLPSITQQSVRH
ncbi:class I SAM-dependent methyltransferase [Metabacillus rhizolycopersici]|uniref:Class I SAM-dependent methyltransferase n=1 Tax=Metabacillus rhizolycopersici TaxID=2875709 RepID=A0ABS7UQM2_9BACI|nr:class I SAM-dependent methyltransferase [Metabacillus rhizolycopersici]MBZ5750605.1 class I SAM-dependent methyltransferase [Metabacillus rhizolycopersici]